MVGITFNDDHQIASDLPCWTCDYNLRTLVLDAACPECGTPVGITLEYYNGRKARPFSLHTLSPIMRTLGLIYGCIGPAMIVLFAAFAPMNPINVEWQSGDLRDYIGVMLSGRAMWAFYPFLAWSYLAYAALMVRPIVTGRKWWVRSGLLLGCVLGLQYQFIISASMMGFSKAFFASVIIGAFALGILAAIVVNANNKDATRPPKHRNKRTAKAARLSVVGTLFVLLVVGLLSRGVILLPILVAGPYLMLICMAAALCRRYRTDFDGPIEPTRPIPAAATTVGYIAAWPIAITQAQIVYNSLPTQPPACYVCTASAHGHRWLTRAKPVQFSDGQVMLVTRQMQTLKAAECLIAKRCPRLHCAMRWVYDRIGPQLASRIQSRWLANMSYLLFAPLAIIAWLILLIIGRGRDIDRAYHG